ncbi:MAG: DUF4328 domain-containing protein, partial [Candidatus Omnitrophota bacterium]
MTYDKNSSFVSGHIRAKRLIAIMWVIVMLCAIAISSNYAQINLLSKARDGYSISQEAVDLNDLRQGIIGILQSISFILAFVFLLMWMHRAHKVLPSLNVQNLKYSPGWAVGGFFVPFLNLVRPYQVMREIWQASTTRVDAANGSSWKNIKASPLVGNWWGLWILDGILARVAGRMAM